MFEKIIEALLPQSPGLVAAIVIVWFGLKYLEAAEKRNSEERKSFLEQIKQMGNSCHEAQQHAVDQLTACVNRNTEALGQVKHALDRAEAHK